MGLVFTKLLSEVTLIGVCGTHLGRGSILLNRWRQGAGAVVGGGGFHIVVAEAAEERAEDAPTPLFLDAAVGLGNCQHK